MYYYEHSIEDVGRWISEILPQHYKDWTEEDSALRRELDTQTVTKRCYSTANFSAFSEKFNHISIRAGLPRGDYGQSVHLSKVLLGPKEKSNCEWSASNLIEHGDIKNIGESAFYSHERSEEGVWERLSFERIPADTVDLSNNGWRGLRNAVVVSRHLSEITHRLAIFAITWSKAQIDINLEASLKPYAKPPFMMYW